jgi:cation diffusion facilitator family transporter
VSSAPGERKPVASRAGEERLLTRLILLSVAAAIVTVTLKAVAWRLTGSVGLLADALESLVNFVAAVVALVAIRWAARPPDREHMYGHGKAEYFAAGFEGALILGASASIAWVAVERLRHPMPLEDLGVGIAVSGIASLVNLAVGLVLIRYGRRHRSIALEADGRHLLTDVWTSAAVIAGLLGVAATGWTALDPLLALLVAANILFTGGRLLWQSGGGLMDRSLSDADRAAIEGALAPFGAEGIRFHALRTRRSGRRSFVSMHVLVPGDWTVREGHLLLERVEASVRAAVPGATTVFTHLEPADDAAAFEDVHLDGPET